MFYQVLSSRLRLTPGSQPCFLDPLAFKNLGFWDDPLSVPLHFFLILWFLSSIIVYLQCVVHFYCTAKWPSHTCTFFFSHYPQSRFITSDWIYFPVIYSRILLPIHAKCDSLPLLIPDSQPIPLPPRPIHSFISPSLQHKCPWPSATQKPVDNR